MLWSNGYGTKSSLRNYGKSRDLFLFFFFFLPLVFGSVVILFPSVVFSKFLLLGVHWSSSICGFVVFVQFGKYSRLFFQILFLYSHCFSESNHVLIVPQVIGSFFPIFFLSLLYFLFISISMSSSPPVISTAEWIFN